MAKVSLPWWRHLLLSFFNLVLRLTVVPSAWKSSLVVPVIKGDGDTTSLNFILPPHFLSYLALPKFSNTWFMLALPPPHIFPQLDPSQGGFRWGADAVAFSLRGHLALPPSRAHLCHVHRH